MKMKQLMVLLMGMLMCIGAQANDRKVTKVTTLPASSDDTESYDYYLYDAQGKLMWVQGISTRDVYTYNEKGLATMKTTLSWVPSDKAYKVVNTEAYTYDAEGKLTDMEQTKNVGTSNERKYVYNDYKYEGEEPISWHMEDVRATTIYKYDYKVILEKDAAGRITSKQIEEYDYDYPEDGFCAYEGYTYTYKENGDIDTEVYKIYNYDYEKVRKTENRTYTYSNLSASYVPTGLEAKVDSKSIVLTWNAVEGATAYAVTYDLEHVTVEGTTLTIKDIALGEHEFSVQAIIGGEEKNACQPVKASLLDPGMMAAENLQAGEPRQSIEETDNGKRTFYIIPFTWTLPQGHSEIKEMRLYYTSAIMGTIYQAVGNQNATSFELKIDEYDVRKTDANGKYTDGYDMEFYLTIVYGSGESEKSNIVKLNPYNVANGIVDALNSISISKGENAYTLGGMKATRDSKGLIIKNGKKILR